MYIPMSANKMTDKFIHVSFDSTLIFKKSRLHKVIAICSLVL